MDLHVKYQNLPTVDLSIILSTQNSQSLINNLIKVYNNELKLQTIDTNNLKIYQMILCNNYQKSPSKSLFENDLSIADLFSHSKNFIPQQFALIKDIIILRLFFDPENISHEFDNFRCIKNSTAINDDNCYMNFIECFVDVFRLRQLFFNATSKIPDNFDLAISRDLEIWYLNCDERKILVSLVPKLIEISIFESIANLWRLLRENRDFTGFCIVINFLSQEKYDFLRFLDDQDFWIIILGGLKSREESTRKQAMFIFKIVAEFLRSEDENGPAIAQHPKMIQTGPEFPQPPKVVQSGPEFPQHPKVVQSGPEFPQHPKMIQSGPEFPQHPKVVQSGPEFSQHPKMVQTGPESKNHPKIPFICEKNRDSIAMTRKNFILILESLDEKRQHLVLPAFGVLNNLFAAHLEHRDCGNCFPFTWLACVFEKIFHHESNAIIKRGVSFVLHLNPNHFDDDFIISLATVLNNFFLYEIENQIPEIFQELCVFLAQSGEKFIHKFLSSIAEISWNPISIFYVTLALSAGTEISFQENLTSLKKLIEINLRHHSPILRKESQKNVLIAVTRGKCEKIDLQIFQKFLVIFPKDDDILARGSESREIILDFLRRIPVEESQMKEFIQESCKNIRENREINIEAFTRISGIIEDLHIMQDENYREDLVHLLYSIHNMNARLYVNQELIDRVLELIFHLVNHEIFVDFLVPFRDDILDCFLQIARKSKLNYTTIEKYSRFLRIFDEKIVNDDLLKKFEQEALYTLKNKCPALRKLYAMKILEICQKLRKGFLSKEILDHFLANYSIPLIFEDDESLEGMKGRATMEFYLTFGKILDFYLETNSGEIPDNCVAIASELFDKAGASGVPFVVGIVAKILHRKSFSDSKNFACEVNLIKTCWKSIVTGKKNRFFWMTLDNIFQVILNPNFFGIEKNFVLEMLKEILNDGETSPNVKIHFLKNLNKLDSKFLIFFKESILNCLLHGQALRKDIKIELQTLEFLSRQKGNLAKFQNHNLDSEIRARGVISLHRAICKDENFSTEFFHLAITKLKKFKGKRYFGDSNSHRIQQRIYQILLILEPILNADCKKKLRDEIIDNVLSNTADQPSIQIMMSWILSRIFLLQNNEPSNLWNFFNEVKEMRPGNLKFAAGVILQISKFLKKDDENVDNFLATAIALLAPECLGPTFNTRLACQMVLVKLYEKMDNTDNLYRATVETLNKKNRPKVNEFYYEDFHLLNNYDLQSIYHQVPRLTNISSDELILPTTFENYGFIQTEKHPLRLFNESNSLNRLQSILGKTKPLEMSVDCCVDLQKKIVPEKLMIFDDRECEKIADNDSIIVVASLVEKIPNLGGIARTCEIFGAGELVLSNKMFIENKEFQSLSVTAEKWIKITEVKPQDLSKYFMEMKEMGWNLIGLEQTANSCSLLEKKFEKKTILLLGNEKDGIPPNLIPILDKCVEIPQVGVIRSLNVHVTGAICIWEYAKQHCFLNEK